MFVWKFHFEAEREGMKFFSLLIILVIFRTKQEKKKNPSLTAIHIHQQSQFMSFFSLLIWLFHVALTNHLPFQHCCFLVTQSCPTLSWPHGLHAVHQASLSMRFARHKYWSGQPFSSPLSMLVNLNIWQRMWYLGIQRIFEERTKWI